MHAFHPTTLRSRSNRRRRATAGDIAGDLVAVATAIAAAVAAIRLLDAQPTSPDDAVVHLAALVALLIAAWWIANVVAWSAAIRRGRQLARFTLPGTKRVAQLVLAVSLSTTACSVGAADSPTMHLVAAADELGATDAAPIIASAPTSPSTTSAPTTAAPTTAAASSAPTESSTAPLADEEMGAHEIGAHEVWEQNGLAASGISPTLDADSASGTIPEHRIVVAAGDNLWVLAEQALVHHGTTEPTVAQIASYWRQVVAANDVRSGNPDLIVPGEAIDMPAFVLAATDR